MRTLALPEAINQWSLTSLREKLVKIGAKVMRHGRYVIFQMAEVAVPKIAGPIVANPLHPRKIISLSRALPMIRTVNVAGGAC